MVPQADIKTAGVIIAVSTASVGESERIERGVGSEEIRRHEADSVLHAVFASIDSEPADPHGRPGCAPMRTSSTLARPIPRRVCKHAMRGRPAFRRISEGFSRAFAAAAKWQQLCSDSQRSRGKERRHAFRRGRRASFDLCEDDDDDEDDQTSGKRERDPAGARTGASLLFVLATASGVAAFTLVSVQQEVELGQQAKAEISKQMPVLRRRGNSIATSTASARAWPRMRLARSIRIRSAS